MVNRNRLLQWWFNRHYHELGGHQQPLLQWLITSQCHSWWLTTVVMANVLWQHGGCLNLIRQWFGMIGWVCAILISWPALPTCCILLHYPRDVLVGSRWDNVAGGDREHCLSDSEWWWWANCIWNLPQELPDWVTRYQTWTSQDSSAWGKGFWPTLPYVDRWMEASTLTLGWMEDGQTDRRREGEREGWNGRKEGRMDRYSTLVELSWHSIPPSRLHSRHFFDSFLTWACWGPVDISNMRNSHPLRPGLNHIQGDTCRRVWGLDFRPDPTWGCAQWEHSFHFWHFCYCLICLIQFWYRFLLVLLDALECMPTWWSAEKWCLVDISMILTIQISIYFDVSPYITI